MSRDQTRVMRDTCAELGITIDRIVTGGKHPKWYVSSCDGRKDVFVVSTSTSDHRANKNKIARLRRFAEGRA